MSLFFLLLVIIQASDHLLCVLRMEKACHQGLILIRKGFLVLLECSLKDTLKIKTLRKIAILQLSSFPSK